MLLVVFVTLPSEFVLFIVEFVSVAFVFEISDEEGYAVAKDVEVTDEEIKEQAVEAMESCPTSAIEEAE